MNDAVMREVKDGLCTITLNRPDKLNALSSDSFRGLAAACDYIASHVSEIGCVLIKGAGRAFCAGNDLGGLTEVFEGGDSSRFRSDTVERLASLPMRSPVRTMLFVPRISRGTGQSKNVRSVPGVASPSA